MYTKDGREKTGMGGMTDGFIDGIKEKMEGGCRER